MSPMAGQRRVRHGSSTKGPASKHPLNFVPRKKGRKRSAALKVVAAGREELENLQATRETAVRTILSSPSHSHIAPTKHLDGQNVKASLTTARR